MSRRTFGNVTTLPSGKYRARYTGPDGHMHSAPQTFFDRDDATAWLRGQQKLIEFGEWQSPTATKNERIAATTTVGDWINQWLEIRSRGTRPLKASTVQDYQQTLDRRILKVGGKASRLRDIPLKDCSRKDVAEWWDAVNMQFDSPPYNRNAYARLKTAMSAAASRDLIPASPVDVEDARSRPKPARKTLPEVHVMDDIVLQLGPEHTNTRGFHRLIAVLTLFHGLRIGEALGLRRKDITVTDEDVTVTVAGNAVRMAKVGMVRQGTPKTDAGHRTVPIFSRFRPHVIEHLKMVGDDPDAMLFATPAGKIVMDTSYRSVMNAAKKRAGHGDVKITPHYGRVWLITALAEAGMPIPEIGRILGQVDLKTITEIYMRASADAVSKALRLMDERLGE